MSTRPWQQSYPAGIPIDINLSQFPHIPAVLEMAFKRFTDKPAFSNMGVRLSYKRVDALSRDIAAYLQGLGLKPGERVVIQMPNLLQYPIILFGALRAGLTVVNLNPLYTSQEMQHHIRDAGAKVIFILENFADKLEKVLPNRGVGACGAYRGGRLVPGAQAADHQRSSALPQEDDSQAHSYPKPNV